MIKELFEFPKVSLVEIFCLAGEVVIKGNPEIEGVTVILQGPESLVERIMLEKQGKRLLFSQREPIGRYTAEMEYGPGVNIVLESCLEQVTVETDLGIVYFNSHSFPGPM